jgi:hypothetical protein
LFTPFSRIFLAACVGCSRPAEPVAVPVPVPVLVPAPPEPRISPLAAVVPLSLGVPPTAIRPAGLTVPDDTGGRLVEHLLRPTSSPPRYVPPAAPWPPEIWADRGHLPLPAVPPPAMPSPPPPADPGLPSPPPDRLPADLGDRYQPDLKRLPLPALWPPPGLGRWLLGLGGGPFAVIPALVPLAD